MISLPELQSFAAHITTATRDEGVIRLTRFMGTQEVMCRAILDGFSDGIRQFVFLKGGRQVGGSTFLDVFTLYWLQKHLGMVGELVSDDDPNMRYRRKVLRGMLNSLPPPYRYPTNSDNAQWLEIIDPHDPAILSTLLFDYAGVRDNSNLGRSKGLNFFYGDEVGSWTDEKAVDACKAAFSERHPHRFYGWISTARGFNVFYDMWREAAHAVSTRRVFIAWWMHDGYRIERDDPRFAAYDGRLTRDEKILIRAVREEFGHELQPEQIVWYRWKLAEEFRGDEAMMAQEYGTIPEECFQAFGDKFIPPHELQRMRLARKKMGAPRGYRFEWAAHLEDCSLHPTSPDKATLKVWEEPTTWGAYIIAGHPMGSSSPNAMHWVADVYRAWPDHLDQVAQFSADAGDCTAQRFAWLLLYLAGYYRDPNTPFLAIEVQGPGRAVEKHLQLFREHGFGLGSSAKAAGVQDFYGAYRHYFWNRPDHLGGKSPTLDLQTNATERPFFLHMLADAVGAQQMTIRSEATLASMAMLRRGEAGDNDQIEGGGGSSDAHALCAVLGVRCWQDQAMGDLERSIPSKSSQEQQRPPTMGEVVVGQHLQNLLRTGRL